MGSETGGGGGGGGALGEPKLQSLARQGSLYSLTLDEVQNQLGYLGKPLGSMNLDELLKSVWSAEGNNRLGGDSCLTLPTYLSKKTVDQVWVDIQQDKNSEDPTFGEMTLQNFLSKAGVTGGGGGGGDNGDENMSDWMPYQSEVGFAPYQVTTALLSDMQTQNRKRVAGVEKTVERRHKRMIKNRESAARSRARKQAYTHELEIKASRLEEENERLRRQKKMDIVLRSAPTPKPKGQLRRTISATF